MSVDFEQRGPFAVITINRPEARNAVNGDVASGIEEAIDKLEADDSIWVGILTGVPPVFCAGADLKEINSGNAGGLSTKKGGFAGITMRERTKPIIAAVDGPALAGGTEIVLSCDLVVASTTATFGIPEVKRNLVAGAGGLFRLGRKIPINIAMELTLTGDPIDAARAHHFGLVNRLVEPGQALDAAIALAEQICANAPLAVRESRKIVLEATNAPDDVGWRCRPRAWAWRCSPRTSTRASWPSSRSAPPSGRAAEALAQGRNEAAAHPPHRPPQRCHRLRTDQGVTYARLPASPAVRPAARSPRYWPERRILRGDRSGRPSPEAIGTRYRTH